MSKRGQTTAVMLASMFFTIVGVQGETITLNRGIEDVEISAELKDGEPKSDGETAGENNEGAGRMVLGDRKGKKRGFILMRLDLTNIKRLDPENISDVQLVMDYNYPEGNPELALYRISDQDADWNVDQATWRQKRKGQTWTGGPGGGEPGEGTISAEPMATYKKSEGESKAVFDIPAEVIREWVKETPVLGKNPGMMIRTVEDRSMFVSSSDGRSHHPILNMEADFEADRLFFEAIEANVKIRGSGKLGEWLLEDALDIRYSRGYAPMKFNPALRVTPPSELHNRWNRMHNACEQVIQGDEGLMLVSRLDWEWRVDDKYKKQLEYVPFARQQVTRMGEVVGGVEYGLAKKPDVWIPQVEAFLYFVRSEDAQDKLAEDDPYGFVPVDTEIPEFEPPEEWNLSPREGPDPMMVHGMDLHGGAFHTTRIAEMQKIRMLGFNSIMFGGQTEEEMEWADQNNMLISGSPNLTEEDREEGLSDRAAAAKKMAQYDCCWGTYLVNEDSAGGWVVSLYNSYVDGEDWGHGGDKFPERVKDFQQVAEGGFARWAKKKHGSLEKLNSRWNTDYESWDEIDVPPARLSEMKKVYGVENRDYQYRLRFGIRGRRYAMAEYPDLLDFFRYTNRVWASWYDEQIKEMRPYLGENFHYTTKAKPEPFMLRASEQFNGASHDHGPGKHAAVENQIFIDTVQIAKGWPVWNSEDHRYHGFATPRRVRYDMFSNYLMGQFQDTAYAWVEAPRNRTTKGDGQMLAEDSRIRSQIRRYEDIFRALLEARGDADLAVLANEQNRAWDEYHPRPEESYLGGAIKAFAYMGALGRHWKYVLSHDVSPEHVTGKLIIDARWLTNETLQKIADLPADRELVVVGDMPEKNEYGEPLPEDELQQVKDRAEKVAAWENLTEAVPAADGLMDPYTRISEAKWWVWNRFRGREAWFHMLPVARLEVRRVKHDGNLYLAVMNHRDRAITAPIPWAEGKEVKELIGKNPGEIVEDPDNYRFKREGVALFEIR